jgi:protein gp37
MGSPKYQTDGHPATSGPGFAIQTHPEALTVPYRWRTPRMIFVDSMSDLLHARIPESFIRDVFTVMADTPHHTYQILTKRSARLHRLADRLDWPANVWVGVSVETVDQLHRVDDLRAVPAAVRFISAEPLLGPLIPGLDLTGIDWVITGGESGPHARPLDLDWVRAIRDTTQTEGVAFFHKQHGGPHPKATGRVLDARTWNQTPTPRPGQAQACAATGVKAGA